jgi:hypothetical protein
MKRKMLAAAMLALVVWPGPVASPEPPQRRLIERADDLPRHTYPVTTAAALMQDDAAFAAFAAQLEADLRADLAAFDIRDRATLKSYYGTLARLALRRGDVESVVLVSCSPRSPSSSRRAVCDAGRSARRNSRGG